MKMPSNLYFSLLWCVGENHMLSFVSMIHSFPSFEQIKLLHEVRRLLILSHQISNSTRDSDRRRRRICQRIMMRRRQPTHTQRLFYGGTSVSSARKIDGNCRHPLAARAERDRYVCAVCWLYMATVEQFVFIKIPSCYSLAQISATRLVFVSSSTCLTHFNSHET